MEVLEQVALGICEAIRWPCFAPVPALSSMLTFSSAGPLHTITFFSLSSLIISVIIAFSGIFLGKLRVVREYEVRCWFAFQTTDSSGPEDIALRYRGRGTQNTTGQEGWGFPLDQGFWLLITVKIFLNDI